MGPYSEMKGLWAILLGYFEGPGYIEILGGLHKSWFSYTVASKKLEYGPRTIYNDFPSSPGFGVGDSRIPTVVEGKASSVICAGMHSGIPTGAPR